MDSAHTSLIDDFPPGPLDFYRKQATFPWKKLKLVFEDPQRIKIKTRVWNTLLKEAPFKKYDYEPSIDDQKRIAALQLHALRKHNFLPNTVQTIPVKQWLKDFMSVGQALVVISPDATVKLIVDIVLAQMSIILLGNEGHKIIGDAVWKNLKPSAFALTEVAHGSDTRNMQTTSTYDENTREFVLNTPNFQAAKCWLGNLSLSCTMAIVFAQLYTKGDCYGLHAFVVPIRHPETHVLYPGVTVIDAGEKLGLNGVDNGLLLFQNYRIPRSNLLNKYADVSDEGKYITSLSSPGKVFSSTIGNLSTGRVSVVQESSEYLLYAITIAIRYAAVRKQFGATKDEELAIIEHQLHQWRLFPHLATAAVLKIFATDITDEYIKILVNLTTEGDKDDTTSESIRTEMHIILCAAKPLSTWACQDAVQQCREACGGHGFLKASGFGILRNTNDARVTYEGDNNILLQQTSRWLLKQWNGLKQGIPVDTPLNTCGFLNDYSTILTKKCTAKNVKNFKFLEDSYQWLLTYLLQETNEKLSHIYEASGCLFTAFNNSQVYKANLLSRVYIEYVVLSRYWSKIQDVNVDTDVKPILTTLGLLYGLSCLDKYLIYFYEGNFNAQCSLSKLVKDAILDLCTTLKCDAVAVVDALAFPDSVMNSVLGKSDGRVYENLRDEFFKGTNTKVPDLVISKL